MPLVSPPRRAGLRPSLKVGSGALVLFGVLVCSAALGHGRPAVPLNVLPTADAGLLIAGTFGVLAATGDGGYAWICDEAMGYGEVFDPLLVRREDGAMLVGSGRGLYRSDDQGCTWSPHGTPELFGVADLVRTSSGALLAVVSASGSWQLHRSDDFGDTWTQVLERSDVQLTSVVTAPSDPGRWYLAARRVDTGGGLLLISENAGGSWREHLLHVDGGAGIPRVLDVSPASAEDVAVGVAEPLADRLLWMGDGGAREVGTGQGAWRGARFSDDGGSLWAAGGGTSGLHRIQADGAAALPLPSPQQSVCVGRGEGALYTCGGQSVDGWSVGRIEPGDGGGVTPLMGWEDIRGPLACPAGTPTAQICGVLWPLFQLQLFGPPPSDGGVEDGGSGVDAGVTDSPPDEDEGGDDGCGCGAGGAGAAFPVVLLLLWAAARSSRRRERHAA